ncbi:MAG: hypothetical protein JXQ68_01365 [Campylobacterales bacterium]|nr:hypothetical protein [Campylobacterales bacterium]
MSENFLESPEYKVMLKRNIYDMLKLLFEQQEEFGVVCDTKNISFEPMLPDDIYREFDEKIYFLLSNYSYESGEINEKSLNFEAGFGPQNFGSSVSIPLLAINQIIYNGDPVVINFATYNEQTDVSSREKSMQALLNNPKNQNLLKKKKKTSSSRLR